MLTKSQVSEIKEHLERAQNPVFFFDNDLDGLCSFLLLQRKIGRGKGVPIKSFPELIPDYFRKVQELNADYIFILDKPLVSKEFFEHIREFNMPVVWIDHHLVDQEIPDFVNYYNPARKKNKDSEPTTFLCNQVSERKEDLWIAVAGCIADNFVPGFYGDFSKNFPDLAIKSKVAFDIYFNSGIGKIAKILDFGLKDRTTNVVRMIKFMTEVKSPYDVMEETTKNFTMHQRYKTINQKYERLLEKAKETARKPGKLLFFQYGGDLSVSSDLSNELSYLFPDKIIVVVFMKGVRANISMRGKNVLDLISKSLEDFEDASGGGHEDAVGGRINADNIEHFKKKLELLIKKN